MIRAVIFDCFGVLEVDASHYFFEHTVPNHDALMPQLLDLNKAVDLGLVTRHEWLEHVAEVVNMTPAAVAAGVDAAHRRNTALVEYAQTLRSDYKLGLCSNIGPGGLDERFSPTEQAALFDVVVCSGDVGVAKPDERIYQVVADQLGVQANECVMIDDSEDNCRGAEAAGMYSIVYQSNGQLKRNLVALLEETQRA